MSGFNVGDSIICMAGWKHPFDEHYPNELIQGKVYTVGKILHTLTGTGTGMIQVAEFHDKLGGWATTRFRKCGESDRLDEDLFII